MSILLQTKAGKRGKRRGGDPRRTGHERAAPDGQGNGLEAVYADGVRLRHGRCGDDLDAGRRAVLVYL